MNNFFSPVELAPAWVEMVHQQLDSWPHRVWVSTGVPPTIVAEAGNRVMPPVPDTAVAAGIPTRVRGRVAVYTQMEAVPGIVVGLAVPADRVHPLLDAVLTLATALFRSDWVASQQRLLSQSLAHEIRGPLTLLMGYGELLTHRGEVELSRLLTDEVRRVDRQIEEFLQAGRPMNLSPVDLRELVETLRPLYEPLASRQGVRLTLSARPTLVLADRPQMETVVANLVRNALDAMPLGGDLRMTVRPVPGGAELIVEDTGPGISSDIRPNLFRPYVSSKTGGHGLGLALSHDIIVRHGGRLETLPADQGAAFRVWIPRGGPE